MLGLIDLEVSKLKSNLNTVIEYMPSYAWCRLVGYAMSEVGESPTILLFNFSTNILICCFNFT